MRCLWMVICRGFAVDRETNTLSLFEIVDELQLHIAGDPQQLPEKTLIPREMSIVSLFARSGSAPEHAEELQLRLVAPGHTHSLGSVRVDLETHQRYRVIARVDALPFSGEGTYTFSLTRGDGSEVAHVAFPVQRIVDPPK